ncbi:hypothetical protein AKJ39_03100 [candidate division MSBL1 archaeon SCGC-AAA259J03]|uniref:Histidine--tRNA ligase n=2 Tax=candidate division MSBL1 TaxID=215777 RepID=A0A656YVS2_9EURY|nr:hypothetical protein AKJ36_00535 [candidate division MSBL1 archaeon SCGC-AAA259I07]KXA97635.1 hypothetical protein AKJ39_03100 [candidate division MSBL1 archaeon SCGC-AAA259J03]
MSKRMDKPRGTRDLWGKKLKRIRNVQEKLESVFEGYGYDEIETPIFERLELFTEKSGSEILDQLYFFEDKSQRELALRPELTAPSIRLYNTQLKSEPKPLKVYYFGPCFRYERPQAGRWRQFLQAGVELIGSERPEADAEVIALTDDSMASLDMEDYTLRIGHIGLLRRVLEHGKISREEQDPILRAIDSEEEGRLEDEFDDYGVSGEVREKIWGLIGLQGSSDVVNEAEEILQDVPDVGKYIDNFRNILKRLRQMGVEQFRLDLGIARGLEYYTGAVFEVYFDDVQLGGGGRYDGLIESLGGEPTPAVGVGLGVDRIAEILEKQGVKMDIKGINAIILPTEDAMLEESLDIARNLRNRGFKIDIDLMGRSLGKALSYADSRGVKYAIIVGPEDTAEGKVTVRDMETGEQEQVLKENITEKIES